MFKNIASCKSNRGFGLVKVSVVEHKIDFVYLLLPVPRYT